MMCTQSHILGHCSGYTHYVVVMGPFEAHCCFIGLNTPLLPPTFTMPLACREKHIMDNTNAIYFVHETYHVYASTSDVLSHRFRLWVTLTTSESINT